jgi:hypothetical protein
VIFGNNVGLLEVHDKKGTAAFTNYFQNGIVAGERQRGIPSMHDQRGRGAAEAATERCVVRGVSSREITAIKF